MEEKLNNLYNQCLEELKSIGIDMLNDKDMIGKIDISISKRNTKRYGCCKQEQPDEEFFEIVKRKNKKIKVFTKFKIHHIEISKWVMQLNDDLIKNTIMHELIHCLPGCNNHGDNFKKYAKIINNKLNYVITRVGDREKDFKISNIEYKQEKQNYKYKIVCENCGQIFYRQRLKKNFTKKYICGKCNGKLKLIYKLS